MDIFADEDKYPPAGTALDMCTELDSELGVDTPHGLERAVEWLAKWTYAVNERNEARRAKSRFVVTLALAIVLTWVVILVRLATGDFQDRLNSGVCPLAVMIWASIGWLCVYFYMVVRKRADTLAFLLFACISIALLLAADLRGVAMGHNRAAAGIIIVIDLLITCEAAAMLQHVVLGAALLWHVLVQVEAAFRFGLLDLDVGLPDAEDRRAGWACDNPPCALGRVALLDGWVFLVTLIGTFVLNRRCMRIMKERQRATSNCVDISWLIARHLADYDLVRARLCLEENYDILPCGLRDAYNNLLDNLQTYKPFLPTPLFADEDTAPPSMDIHSHTNTPQGPHSHSAPQVRATAVPGLGSKPATIVFTDIKGSTALWEAMPEAMDEAVKRHDTVIRREIDRGCGYEVKTIGDAFMVAFPDLLSGIEFGIKVLVAFESETWPEGLPALQLRIGAAHGDVSARENELTCRYDFYGPVVNKAARLEAAGDVGVVTVDSEQVDFGVRRQLEDRGIKHVQGGATLLRGLSQETQLCSLMSNDAEPMARRGARSVARVEKRAHAARIPPQEGILQLREDMKFNRGLKESRKACIVNVLFAVPDVTDEVLLSQALGSGLAAAISAARQCQGTLVGLDGTSLTLAWGVERTHRPKSSDRFINSLRFCTLVRRGVGVTDTADDVENIETRTDKSEVDTVAPGSRSARTAPLTDETSRGTIAGLEDVHFGIACGPVYFGYLGTSSVQMVAAVGHAVGVAEHLVQLAYGARVGALVGTLEKSGYATHPVVGQCLHPAPLHMCIPDAVVHVLDENEAVQIWQDKIRHQQDGKVEPASGGAQLPRPAPARPYQPARLESVGSLASAASLMSWHPTPLHNMAPLGSVSTIQTMQTRFSKNTSRISSCASFARLPLESTYSSNPLPLDPSRPRKVNKFGSPSPRPLSPVVTGE
eukprot:TRINITY_DN5935_c0_g1_i1.p1 TRINITY_DN5935_c0_g1~~TRINITY_DN5935_c0_g1_i1.p1  ORF type:complete len:937 (+),score=131.02 TRINITY_DN5935_c0_g1_i1:75-2885(+)